MPETITAPAAPAATTSAPATTTAPASTAAPTTSAAPSTGAAVETTAPATTTETPATETSPFAGKSIEETILQTLTEKREAREKAAAGEATAPEKTDDEKLAAELGTDTPEEVKAGEVKTGEEPNKEAETTSEFDLDEPDFSTKWLDDLAKENKITFADERAKGQLFKVVREHSEFRPIAEIFGGDLEEAQAAQTGSVTFQHFDGLYEQAHTPEGTRGFLEALAAKQQQEPIIGQDGQPVDVVSALFNNMRDMDFAVFEKQFKEKGDDEALAALDILRERISPNRAPASENIPPELAKREAAVKEREDALVRTQQQQSESARTQYEQTVATDLDTEIGKVIDPILGKTAFSPVIQADVKNKIFDRVMEALDKSPLYKSKSEVLLNKPPTAENKAALMAFKMKWFNQVAPRVMKETIREYRDPVVKAQAERDQKQAAQVIRSRVEPKGPSVSTAPVAQLSKEQQVTKTISDLATKLGRQPSHLEVIEATLAAKAQSRAARS
jgi:hypothetical protein